MKINCKVIGSSNGSTSMASVCASSLSLMDGGVPIKEHVAGIAMGVMMYENKYTVLTDIQGPEDHYGGMDLKVSRGEFGSIFDIAFSANAP